MTTSTILKQAGREAAAAKTWRQAPCQCRIAMGAIERSELETIPALDAWLKGHQEELWNASDRQLGR